MQNLLNLTLGELLLRCVSSHLTYGGYRAASDERGFTLIEVLIVLAIIGILAGIIWPNYTSHQRIATARQGALSLMAFASLQERVRSSRGAYQSAAVLQSLQSLPDRVTDVYRFEVDLIDGGGGYLLQLLPIDQHLGYESVSLDSRGHRTPSTVWP